MSDIDLSFEQLRQDIFESILSSIGSSSYAHIHNAISYGKDPEQLILPEQEDSVLLGQYGILSMRYMIPNHYPINFNIALTLGRLNYSLKINKSVADDFGITTQSFFDLADEVGIKCGHRCINDEMHFEFYNDPTLVWAPSAINILRSKQLEHAFKEFVRLQAEKLILSISGILANHKIVKPRIPGIYAVIIIRSMGRFDIFEDILMSEFTIISKDNREPLNVLYAVRAKKDTPTPLMQLDAIIDQLSTAGYNCAVRPAWSFSDVHPKIAPIERVVEKIVEVEVEKIVEVEKKEPEIDIAALLTEARM